MKANSTKVMQEKMWREVMEGMVDNLVLVLYVLHEQHGFGEKRLTEFLNAVQEKAAEFNEMTADGVIDIKTEEERRRYAVQLHELLKLRSKSFLPLEMWEMFYKYGVSSNQEALRETHRKQKAQAENPSKKRRSCKISLWNARLGLRERCVKASE